MNDRYCNNAYVTVPIYYLQCNRELPPKELQYDGWKTELVKSSSGYSYTLPQYWVLLTRKPVPEELRMPGWDTDKFIYKRLQITQLYTSINGDVLFNEDIEHNFKSTVLELYGNIYDAYCYYNIDYGCYDKYREKLAPYKISDDGTC